MQAGRTALAVIGGVVSVIAVFGFLAGQAPEQATSQDESQPAETDTTVNQPSGNQSNENYPPLSFQGKYILASNTWFCASPTSLYDIDKRELEKDELRNSFCIPTLYDTSVDVMAFQGKYAYICDIIPKTILGTLHTCSYTMTKYLRDKHGQVVPDHLSKGEKLIIDPPPIDQRP